MKYRSAAALDRAITDVLLREAGGDAGRYQQSRRDVAFERVLARLVAEDQDVWLLKGGVALDYRLRKARSTLDLDLSSRINLTDFQQKVVRALAINLGDYFEINLSGDLSRPVDEIDTYRFGLDVRLNNKTFIKISIDVGFADLWLGDAEVLASSETLAFAGVGPVVVKAIPIEQHISEKLHAYTKSYDGRPSSRVKDLVDLVLLSNHRPIEAKALFRILESVFCARATHGLPKSVPPPPISWGEPYRKLSQTLPITSDVGEAHMCVAAFLDPVLEGPPGGQWWDSTAQAWTLKKPSLVNESRQ